MSYYFFFVFNVYVCFGNVCFLNETFFFVLFLFKIPLSTSLFETRMTLWSNIFLLDKSRHAIGGLHSLLFPNSIANNTIPDVTWQSGCVCVWVPTSATLPLPPFTLIHSFLFPPEPLPVVMFVALVSILYNFFRSLFFLQTLLFFVFNFFVTLSVFI